MVKRYLLSSAPGVKFKTFEPSFNPFPAPSSKHRKGRAFLTNHKPPIYLPLQESDNNPVKELLEIPSTDTEINTEKGFSQLLNEDKNDEKKVQIENDQAFEKAAKKYLDSPIVRRSADIDEQPPLSPPNKVVQAEMATTAAAASPSPVTSKIWEDSISTPRKKTTPKVRKNNSHLNRKSAGRKSSSNRQKSKKPRKTAKNSIKAKLNNFRVQ